MDVEIPSDPNIPLNTRQAAKFCQCSTTTLHRARRDRRCPLRHLSQGKGVRYLQADLIDWMARKAKRRQKILAK